MAILKLTGVTADAVINNNSGALTSDRTYTFPNASGEFLLTNGETNNLGTGGSAGYAQVVGYQQGIITCSMGNNVTLFSNYNTLWFTRVGSLVSVGGQIRVEGDNGGNSGMVLNNLPYNTNNIEGQCYTTGSLRLQGAAFVSTVGWATVATDRNSSVLYFSMSRDANSDAILKATQNGYYCLGISYLTSDATWTPNTGSVIS